MIDSFYANNATSAMAIETTIDKAALFKDLGTSTDTFLEKYVGVENAGKPIRLPPNTKLVPIHQKFADAQVIETQKHAREEIANLFGIPKFMLQSENNEASIEQQTRQFLAFTINPIIEIYKCELESKLLTTQEINKGYQIMYDTEKLVETDTKTKTDVIALQVSKGLATPNEGAKKLGNKPIASLWADMHWVQSQNNPIEKYEVWGNNQLGVTQPAVPPTNQKPPENENREN
jgi:phage portal protein BeeE